VTLKVSDFMENVFKNNFSLVIYTVELV
jgi:hypothetical protein